VPANWPLAEIAAGDLGETIPGHDGVVLGLLLAVSGYSFAATLNVVTS
jgi:hypothetical protein